LSIQRLSYALDGWGLIPGRASYLYVLISVQAHFGITQASVQLLPRALPAKRRRLDRDADSSSPSSPEIKTGGAVPSLLHTLNDIVLCASRGRLICQHVEVERL
jgi:hypothetical protein